MCGCAGFCGGSGPGWWGCLVGFGAFGDVRGLVGGVVGLLWWGCGGSAELGEAADVGEGGVVGGGPWPSGG